MPYYRFREVITPFRLFGIRLFRDQYDRLWVKAGSSRFRRLHRKRIEKQAS